MGETTDSTIPVEVWSWGVDENVETIWTLWFHEFLGVNTVLQPTDVADPNFYNEWGVHNTVGGRVLYNHIGMG